MKKNIRTSGVFNLVLFSIFAALILLLGLIPQIGFIRLGPVAITIVHIPVLIGIMVLPFWHALGLGVTFGISSLIASYIYGTTPADLAFQNPLISVLPRIIFALFAFLIFRASSLLQKLKHGNKIIFGLSTIVTILFFGISINSLTNVFSSQLALNLVQTDQNDLSMIDNVANNDYAIGYIKETTNDPRVFVIVGTSETEEYYVIINHLVLDFIDEADLLSFNISKKQLKAIYTGNITDWRTILNIKDDLATEVDEYDEVGELKIIPYTKYLDSSEKHTFFNDIGIKYPGMNNKEKTRNIIMPIMMIVAGLFITAYYSILTKKENIDEVVVPATTMISTIFHTVIVLTALGVVKPAILGGGTIISLISVILGANGFVEAIAATLIVPIIVTALRAAFPETKNLPIYQFIFLKPKTKDEKLALIQEKEYLITLSDDEKKEYLENKKKLKKALKKQKKAERKHLRLTRKINDNEVEK